MVLQDFSGKRKTDNFKTVYGGSGFSIQWRHGNFFCRTMGWFDRVPCSPP